jgi:hypothetical protein
MTGQFFNIDKKNRRIFQIAAIVIILISFWSFGNSFQAAHASVDRQQNPTATIQMVLLQTADPTPEVILTPTEITAEVIREGKPIGILVGAIAIVLVVFISTIPQLIHYYRENQITKKN